MFEVMRSMCHHTHHRGLRENNNGIIIKTQDETSIKPPDIPASIASSIAPSISQDLKAMKCRIPSDKEWGEQKLCDTLTCECFVAVYQ